MSGGPTLPDVLSGHWETEAGADMAKVFTDKTRDDLCMGAVTDFALANEVYMKTSDVILATAAKDRIRWLSVLAASHAISLIEQMAKVRDLQKEVGELRALLKQRADDIAKAQPDPTMPRLSERAIGYLEKTAEATWVCANGEDERIEGIALEMLVAWQRAVLEKGKAA